MENVEWLKFKMAVQTISITVFCSFEVYEIGLERSVSDFVQVFFRRCFRYQQMVFTPVLLESLKVY